MVISNVIAWLSMIMLCLEPINSKYCINWSLEIWHNFLKPIRVGPQASFPPLGGP